MRVDVWHRFVGPAVAALVAGAMNAMAGGGSFLSFPALLGAQLLPVTANATNTVAMWPGELASVFAFRQEFGSRRHGLLPLVLAGTLGGAAGAVVLIRTPQARFLSLVPWLLLFATALFALGDPLRRGLDRAFHRGRANASNAVGLFIGLLLVSFYTATSVREPGFLSSPRCRCSTRGR